MAETYVFHKGNVENARTEVGQCRDVLGFLRRHLRSELSRTCIFVYYCIKQTVLMTPPLIEQSTQDERRAYVLDAWKCLHNCELCGKCHVLKGQDVEILYADYIEGRRSYMEVTLDIRNRSY